MPKSRVSASPSGETDLPPEPGCLIESLRSIGYTLDTAIADLIDNSLTADATEIRVRFSWNNADPWVAVIDNGCGMPEDRLIAAMRFGSQDPASKRSHEDLGRFGLGLKTASISQCRRFRVISWCKAEIHACEWDLDWIQTAGGNGWRLKILGADAIEDHPFIAQSLRKRGPHGTIVLWRVMDRMMGNNGIVGGENGFEDEFYRTSEHVRTVFHRFIKPDRPGRRAVKILFNDRQLTAFDPFNRQNNATQELPVQELRLDGSTIAVRPYILPHRNKVSTEEFERHSGSRGYFHHQGFYVYRNRRLIIQGTWFRLQAKQEISKYIRVQIDIPNSLDHLWKIDVLKSVATPPALVRDQLRQIIGRISDRGRDVTVRRSARLDSRKIAPVWSREVESGRIEYRINRKHPLVEQFLGKFGNLSDTSPENLLRLIESSFPVERCYNDYACDPKALEGQDDQNDQLLEAAVNLARSLRMNGEDVVSLLSRIATMEPFAGNSEILEKITKTLEQDDPKD